MKISRLQPAHSAWDRPAALLRQPQGSQRQAGRKRLRVGALVCLSLMTLLVAGCDNSTSGEAAPKRTATNERLSPEQILDRVAAAYQKARHYADSGELRFRRIKGGKYQESEPIPFSVTFERPNKLRLHAYDASLVSDGKQIKAAVAGVPDQVLLADAPRQLTMGTVLADPVLTEAVHGEFEVAPPQLRLLLSDEPLEQGLSDGGKLELLDDERIDEQPCHRVQMTGPDGTSVCWVDRGNYLVRRIEFPVTKLKKKVDPEGKLEAIELWADFEGARFDVPAPAQAFEFDAEGARLVSRFVAPAPEVPYELLGKQPGKFAFVDLEGNQVNPEALKGKVAVLDMWATWCHWCFKGFPNLADVAQKYEGNDKVMFLAVNTKDPDATDDAVREAMASADIKLPIVRDQDDVAGSVFKVDVLPTMLVLGSDGSVQVHERGYQADLPKKLPQQIDRLLTGENLADETLAQYERERAAFEKQLADAQVTASTVVEIPQAKIAPRTEPANLKLTKLWSIGDLKTPGNILVIESGEGEHQIFVIEGWRTVAEVNPDGKLVTRHQLEIPLSEAVSFLRTAVDKEGHRWFAAFASTQQRLYLFDSQWKRTLVHPDSEHAGIADVQFSDMDGDGQPELNIGYLGAVGVHHVSLSGERQWSNRSLENVLRLAVVRLAGREGEQLLCTSGSGQLTLLGKDGEVETEFQIPNRAVHTVVAAELDGEPPIELCGASAGAVGKTTAIGFDPRGKELWSYHLPDGLHQQPIEMISFGQILKDGPGHWIFAAPDGSIHFVAADGKPLDKFAYGAPLAGVATTTLNDQHVLLVSSGSTLTAWKFEPK